MLSPYLKPQAVNGGMGVSGGAVASVLYGTRDALDKRESSGSFWSGAISVADVTKDISETITNAVGIRSPYFVIGEIPKEAGAKTMWSSQDRLGTGVVRAVAYDVKQIAGGNSQEGVIIDCLGDVTADVAVEFTQRPIFYQSSTVMDSRIRKPVIIKATVAVSNHLSDDLKGQVISQVGNLDATGLTNLGKNALLYGGNTRAQYALYKLRWLMENGQPFTVYTPHGYYENMLIQSLKPQTNETTMDMLLCDIVYQEAILTAPYGTLDELMNRRTPQRESVMASDNSQTRWGSSVMNWFR